MQCWRVTLGSPVCCATDHELSLFSAGFCYTFTVTSAGWRERPAFNLSRRLITFTAKQRPANDLADSRQPGDAQAMCSNGSLVADRAPDAVEHTGRRRY